MLQLESALKGYAIKAADGALGSVSDFLFNDETWEIRWLVVDTGGWLTGRKILIHPIAIGKPDDTRQTLPVSLTKAQVRNSPDVLDDQPVSRRSEQDLYGYYGWDPLWPTQIFAGGAVGTPPLLAPFGGRAKREIHAAEAHDAAEVRPEDRDPHLQSTTGLSGYHIHASDGYVSHVIGFLIDNRSWDVCSIIVDTRNWWPGKHVLLAPTAVTNTDREIKQIRLNITCHQVETSKNWNPTDTPRGRHPQLPATYGDRVGSGDENVKP
jgi:hypothetical protein